MRNARLLASLLAQKSITAHDRRHHLGWVRCTGQSLSWSWIRGRTAGRSRSSGLFDLQPRAPQWHPRCGLGSKTSPRPGPAAAVAALVWRTGRLGTVWSGRAALLGVTV